MLRSLHIFVLCGLLWACPAMTTSIQHHVIERGAAPGQRFAAPRFEVITDAARFRQVFHNLHADQIPPPPAPVIDFERALVILVAMGQRPTAGYRVEIDQVEQQGEALQVSVRYEKPLPQSYHAAVVTQPFVLAQAPKTPGVRRVIFVDQTAKELSLVHLPR